MWCSYSLLRDFVPQSGYESFHCHRKRGYSRLLSKDSNLVKSLNKWDSTPQKIGKLSQQGIFHLYHNPQYLTHSKIEIIASKFLNIEKENEEVQNKVFQTLKNYVESPFLTNKKVTFLEAENSKSDKIKISFNAIDFILFYKFDCVVKEDSETLHIIDFKTGKENYDLRQAFIYLLAGKYLYKDKKCIASFYNLESNKQSEVYSALLDELECMRIQLAKIALKYKEQEELYYSNRKLFDKNFPGSPGNGCQNCPFRSICEDYAEYQSHDQPSETDPLHQ